ncbi:MAG: hypothetical protein V4607_01950 [Pseudomonadota bacterium]
MRALKINGMRVELAGNVLPVHVRNSKKIGPGDYIVVDDENDILGDTHTTFDDAAKELYELAGVEVKNGLPVYSKGVAMRSTEPCFAQIGSGLLFLHDPERRDRLALA